VLVCERCMVHALCKLEVGTVCILDLHWELHIAQKVLFNVLLYSSFLYLQQGNLNL